MHKCLKLIFNKEYGVLKSQNYERISLELLNKHYHITENDFKNKDYCLDKFNSKDILIGSFQSNNLDYYLHVKIKTLFNTIHKWR